jgi:hypothetical protein
MKGIYKFYQNGELIHEQENSLTVVGRSLIIKSMLGLIPSVGGSLAVGVDGRANPTPENGLINLNNLYFAIAETPVELSSLGVNAGSKDALVFKGTISDSQKYLIYEVGLYPEKFEDQVTEFSDLLLFNGEVDDDWKVTISSTEFLLADRISESSGSRIIESGNYRIGDKAALIDPSQTIYSTTFTNNFTTFGTQDIFKLAIYANGSTTATVKFMKTDGTFYSKQWTGLSTGYQILSCLKSELLPTYETGATLDWAEINKISVTAGSSSVIFDGMKFDRADVIDSNYGLISRASLSSPIQKKSGEPLTIEYYLALSFNEV